MPDFEMLKGKKVALMGGAGFIGHNLAIRLKAVGAFPFIVDALQVNSLGALLSDADKVQNKELYISLINERLELIRDADIKMRVTDLRDYDAVSKIMGELEPDCVVHLAAVSHANRSNKDPFSTFDHSLRTLENTLDNCKNSKTHVIYFSSSMVYGDFGGETATEDQVCNPLGIYGALKYSGEKMVIAYNQVFDMPFTIIRPSALYGERCISRRVVQAFIENAVVGKDLSVNGDGSDELDFTYIEDLIQGVMRSISNPKAINEIFNITFGRGRSIKELASIVAKHFPGIGVDHQDRDVLMPERGTLSIEKARNLIGYKPKFCLETALETYVHWYRNLSHYNNDQKKS